jgi:hypothetical protein
MARSLRAAHHANPLKLALGPAAAAPEATPKGGRVHIKPFRAEGGDRFRRAHRCGWFFDIAAELRLHVKLPERTLRQSRDLGRVRQDSGAIWSSPLS